MDGIDTAIQTLLNDSQRAIVIWLFLTLTAAGAFALLVITGRTEWFGVSRSGMRWASQRHAILAVHCTEAHRRAGQLEDAAHRARAEADARHREWQVAQQAAEDAWASFEQADDRMRVMRQAAAIPLPPRRLTPQDVAARQRQLHRLAAAAFDRGDLSVDQLLDALAGRNGFDPCRHPADQEVMLWEIARQRRAWSYQVAARVERAAWHCAHLAAETSGSMSSVAHVQRRRAELAQRDLRTASRPRSAQQLLHRLAAVPIMSTATGLCESWLSVWLRRSNPTPLPERGGHPRAGTVYRAARTM